MKNNNVLWIGPLILLISVGSQVSAQSGGQFEMVRSSIDSGSQTKSSGGLFEVAGSIGQFDASITPLTGAEFELSGGLWPGHNDDIIFKNNFE